MARRNTRDQASANTLRRSVHNLDLRNRTRTACPSIIIRLHPSCLRVQSSKVGTLVEEGSRKQERATVGSSLPRKRERRGIISRDYFREIESDSLKVSGKEEYLYIFSTEYRA